MQTDGTTHRYVPPQQLWPSTPTAVHDARHELLKRLAEWGLPELGDQAGLVLSEQATRQSVLLGRFPDLGRCHLRDGSHGKMAAGVRAV